MMDRSILTAVQRMIETGNTSNLAEGTVQTISGATANVLVSGSNRAQPAWYLKGIPLSPGDSCLLMRSPQGDRWIVIGAFSTNIGGSSETLLTKTGSNATASASAGAYRNNSVARTFGGSISLANANNSVLATIVLATTKATATIQVGFSGYLQGTTTGLNGGVRLIVGGATVAESVGSLSSSVAANARENLATTGMRFQVPQGTYTVQLQAITNSVSGADNILIVSPQFYAIEI